MGEEGQTRRRLFDEKHFRVEVDARVLTLHPPLVDLSRVDVRRHNHKLLVRYEHLNELEQEELANARVELRRYDVLFVNETTYLLTTIPATRFAAIHCC